MNDDKLASRIVITGQMPVVYAIKGTLELNSQIAVTMRATLESKMIDLLVSQQEGLEVISKQVQGYDVMPVDEQIFYEKPYLETNALVNETAELEYSVANSTGAIRIEEKSTARKDRYTALSYGNYFASLLEQDLLSDNSEYEFVALYN